jgi:hypothetical protein
MTHDMAKEYLELEARMRGTSPEEELHRRIDEELPLGFESRLRYRIGSDKITLSRNIGRRVLDEIKDLIDLPLVPSREPPTGTQRLA